MANMLRAQLPKVEGPRLAKEPRPLTEEVWSTLVTRGTGQSMDTLLKELGWKDDKPIVSPLFLVNEDGRISSSSVRLSGRFWGTGHKGRQIWSSASRNLSVEVRIQLLSGKML